MSTHGAPSPSKHWATTDHSSAVSGWKHRYGATVLTAVVRHVSLVRPVPYQTLLDLDKEVRQSHVAPHLKCPVDHSDGECAWSADPAKALQQYALTTMHECSALHLPFIRKTSLTRI